MARLAVVLLASMFVGLGGTTRVHHDEKNGRRRTVPPAIAIAVAVDVKMPKVTTG